MAVLICSERENGKSFASLILQMIIATNVYKMKVKFYGMIHTLLNDNKFHVITFSATDKKFHCVKGMKLFFNLYNQQGLLQVSLY